LRKKGKGFSEAFGEISKRKNKGKELGYFCPGAFWV
jgi:hypothetical protein